MKPLLACIGLLLSASAFAAGLPDARHIIVTGQGHVEAVPDIATLHLSVETTDPSLAEAKNRVDTVTGRVIEAARALGIREEDIGASDIHANPQYEWRQGERSYRGERVSRNIRITLRNIDRYGKLVHRVIEAGVSRISHIELDFSDRDKLESQALQKAIVAARRKAGVIAKSFEARLGEVYQIDEAPAPSPPEPYAERLQADTTPDGGDSLKVGKQKIQREIRAVFYLED